MLSILNAPCSKSKYALVIRAKSHGACQVHEPAVEEKAASLGVVYLGHPVTADGVSVNGENTEEMHQTHGNEALNLKQIVLVYYKN